MAFGWYGEGLGRTSVNCRESLTRACLDPPLLLLAGTGVFTSLFGFAYFWQIHDFWYFVCVQIMAGLFQSTGWPSVVAVMGRWFGKGKRGLIMGVWNAHTSGRPMRTGCSGMVG